MPAEKHSMKFKLKKKWFKQSKVQRWNRNYL